MIFLEYIIIFRQILFDTGYVQLVDKLVEDSTWST